MTVVENLPVLSREFHLNEIRGAFSHFEITGIFNKHGTIEDAQESVSYVEPDSIVYIEGLNTKLPTEESLFHWARVLADKKRTFGKDEDYYRFKELLITDIRSTQIANAVRKKAPDDFSEHMLEELRLLIEKDCDVIVADYRHSANEDIKEAAQELSSFIENSLDNDFLANFDDVKPNEGTANHILKLINAQHDAVQAHDERELFAGILLGSDAATIVSMSDWFTNVNRNPSGKIRAYIVYGTAHAKSLSHRLREMGATIKPVIVNEISENRYFDKSYEDFLNNRRRRYAFAAFEGIMYAVGVNIHDNAHDEFISSLYAALEELNEDGERAAAFCTNCLKILQRSESDPEGAHKEFEQLLQPYMNVIVNLDNTLLKIPS